MSSSEPISCPGCGRRIASRLQVCPYCRATISSPGAPPSPFTPGDRRVLRGVGVVVVAVALLLGLTWLYGHASIKKETAEQALRGPDAAPMAAAVAAVPEPSAAAGAQGDAAVLTALGRELDAIDRLLREARDEVRELRKPDESSTDPAVRQRYRRWAMAWLERVGSVRPSPTVFRVEQGGRAATGLHQIDQLLAALVELPFAGTDIGVVSVAAQCWLLGASMAGCVTRPITLDLVPPPDELQERLSRAESRSASARAELGGGR